MLIEDYIKIYQFICRLYVNIYAFFISLDKNCCNILANGTRVKNHAFPLHRVIR